MSFKAIVYNKEYLLEKEKARLAHEQQSKRSQKRNKKETKAIDDSVGEESDV